MPPVHPLPADSALEPRTGRGFCRWLWAAAPVLLAAVSSLAAVVLIDSTTSAVQAQPSEGGDLYLQFCASCHQPGGEGIPGAFPPLAGNPAAADAENVRDAIANGRSGPVEVLGVAYDGVMEPVPELSGSELDVVVDYVTALAGPATGSDGAAEPPERAETSEESEETAAPAVGDADEGEALFRGSRRFDRGGGACAACHTAGSRGNLGGGTLGPDLSMAFATLGGEPGLTGWLANPPSRTMDPIYADRPLADAEIADLVAYLATTAERGPSDDALDGLVVGGSGGALALLAGMAVAWRGMRQTYHQRLHRLDGARRSRS